jgi:aquaporin Z
MSESAPAQAGTSTPAADDAEQTDASVARNVVTEMLGSSLVMLAGPGAIVLSGGAISNLAVAFSFGMALAISIGVIGAVANPMFTLALRLIREISLREAIGDWTGQILGAILGGAAIWGINDLTRSGVGANGWDRNGFGQLGSVMAAEFVFGIILVVVLLASISQGRSMASIAAFTGGMYGVGMLILREIDGGGLNPARSLGSAIFSDTSPSALGQLWLFILVPLVAAFVAVFVWLTIDDAEIDDTVFDETILDDAQNLVTGDTTD